MQTKPIGVNVGEGLDVVEGYVGPGVRWIANRLCHPVRFEYGWFWTAATCHGEGPDEMAFRQRPDGNGVEALCLSHNCTPEVAVDALGRQAGWFLRGPTAYEPLFQAPDWPWWRTAWYVAAALVFTVPLLLGHDLEAGILNVIGFSAGSLLTTRCLSPRRGRRFRR